MSLSAGMWFAIERITGTPYGIAIPKDPGMDKPILDAVKALIANGQYKSILQKWGVADGAITSPVINGAVS